MDNKTEQLAAERLLENGVRLVLPAPFLFRLFRKKNIALVVKQPYLGTLLHISKLVLSSSIDFDKIDQGDLDGAHELVQKHASTLSKIVASAFLNGRFKIKVLSGLLAWWLLFKISPRKLAEFAFLIVALCGLEDFTNSIRLIRTLKMTDTKSPTDQGS